MVSTRRDRGSEEQPRTRGRVDNDTSAPRRSRGRAEHEDDALDTDDGLPDHQHRRRSSRLMETTSHGKAEDEQQDISDDDEIDSEVEDDDEDDEDVRVGRGSMRTQREQARQYKLRRRSIKTPATQRLTRSGQYAAGIAGGGSDSEEDDSDDDGSEGDDEQDGLEDDGPDGVVVGSGRYKLRDRELVTIKRPPPPPGTGGTEVARKRQKRSLDQPRTRHQSSRHGSGVSMQRGGNRHAAISDDDELPDVQNGSDWRYAMAPVTFLSPRHPSAGGMLPNTPRQAAAHGGGGSGGGREPAPLTLADAAVNLGREKAANAEITPLEVDPSLGFDQVGGLAQYVRALKEMVFLPLVYPELFARFHVQPPRGVLFYGPPGTGKTLVARALAAHASRAGRKVSFFMRKGADILSKWVGEAERQLRLLFEEAQRQQPSIIFFDEIDGLAPVRSSRQDQIHNSIVSTLLALMDGLDSRGQVVIIGATNRIDAIDGALRRPGRFDRELLFPLPDVRARREILDIHTTKWSNPPAEELKLALADQCVGYCGADLKALCAEAALAALRRSYPQIYASEQRLLLDPCSVQVTAQDFQAARSAITPASHRAAATHAAPLGPLAAPCLDQQLQQVLSVTRNIFPPAQALHTAKQQQEQQGAAATAPAAPTSQKLLQACSHLPVRRARVLLCGREGAGQSQLGPAVLHELEGLPAHAIGLPSLLADAGSRSLEEALVHAFVEARRAAPAVLYLPHLELWWATAPVALRATLCMLLAELPPELPLLLLATAEVEPAALEPEARKLFAGHSVLQMGTPSTQQRKALFQPVVHAAMQPPAAQQAAQDTQAPCELPVDPAVQQQEQEAAAQAQAQAQRLAYEAAVADLRQLRMLLRSVTASLLCDKRFRLFWQPVSPEEEPEYYEAVKAPMDLATVLARVDQRRYATAGAFMADMHAIVAASQQYWGDSPQYIRELSRAHELHDEALALLAARVPQELRDRCDTIEAAGGPKPPPGIAPEQVPAAGAGHATPWDASDPHRSKRTHTRSKSAPLSDEVLYGDPEASMRMLKQLKRQGQHSSHGGSKQHKAEPQQEQSARPEQQREQQEALPGTVQHEQQQGIGTQPAGDEQHEQQNQEQQHISPQQEEEQQPTGVDAAPDPAEPPLPAAAAAADVGGTVAASSKQRVASSGLQHSDLQAVPDQQPAPTAVHANFKGQAVASAAQLPAQQAGPADCSSGKATASDTQAAQQAAPVPQQPAAPSPELLAAADAVLETVVHKTHGMLLGQLELAVQQLSAVLQEHTGTQDRAAVLQAMAQVAGKLGASSSGN